MSDAADGWLTSLLGDPAEPGMALVAVGGYGRQELCPFSDLDVVLVHAPKLDLSGVAEVADRIWYPVWDAGIGLDHSVRTVKEALAVAGTDLKAALGLLDARFVAGDEALADELIGKAREQWRHKPAAPLAALRDAVAARHESFGDVAFLLEPEVKEGHGGLRDVHALRAVAAAVPALSDVADVAEVADAEDVLLRARVELHRRVGRASDRLALQEQDAVASALEFADADALMASVAGAARTIAWQADDAWRRVPSPLAAARRRQAGRDRPLGPGLYLRGGEVVLGTDADVDGDPSLPLRAAVAWATTGAPLGRSDLDRLGASSPPAPEVWPRPMRDALVALLGSGHAAVPVIEALDQKDLVARVLPEWANVRSKPQRNAYHRFTVDRHLVETAANAAAMCRDVARPDLLLVGALLHDIGKGLPGDHTETGMEAVARIGARLGFGPADVDVLVAMVRHHLLLPDVATRRDLDDPATITLVAEAVGDRETLDLLAALTVADSEATGPAAWGTWKAGLVAELVARVAGRLAGHHAAAHGPHLLDRFSALISARQLDVVVADGEVVVVAPDRPGLFTRVAGALSLHGLDVREAQAASSDDGMAVECFTVASAAGRSPDWDRVRADVERAAMGRLAIEARLAARVRDYAPARRASAASTAEPRVLFDNDTSPAATIIEVRAPDAIGVLYRITRALADCDLDVRTAKVSTLGHEVVDAFYVVDSSGAKVVDGDHLVEVERAVLAELSR